MSGKLTIYAVAVLATACCAGIHYESLRTLASASVIERSRHGILILVGALLAVHFAEICVYAGAYYFMAGSRFGTIQGADTFHDYIYYSASVYTTLGIGDLHPVGALRALTAVEAILGLTLIAWSASFTFFEMQRHWSRR